MKQITDNIRILVAIRGDAGDIFIMTGVVNSLKKKFPNSKIYFACLPKYQGILKDNPDIFKVINYHQSMLNYRLFTKWAFEKNNPFDISYCPAILTQENPPHNWLNGKYTYYLGDFYANQCNVEYGKQFIRLDDVPFELPSEYITLHSTSQQGPKNYSDFQQLIDKIKLPIVQVGGASDKILKNVAVNLCGKTTFQQVTSVLKGAKCHLGLDSILMHLAAYVNTPSVILFGGTLPEAGCNPRQMHLIHPVEPEDRSGCITSCHLLACPLQQRGLPKCIDNIQVEDVLCKLREVLGEEYVTPAKPVSLGAYFIASNVYKYGFPIEKALNRVSHFDEIVINIDTNSKDETLEKIKELGKRKENIKIVERQWNKNKAGFVGEEKAFAASCCNSTHRIQLDADEFIIEPEKGMLKAIVKRNQNRDCIDLPIINLYGDSRHIRIEYNCWKWRIYRNDPNITHGPHAAARIFDAETGEITADRDKSDFCEPIYADSLKIVRHVLLADAYKYVEGHELFKNNKIDKEEYIKRLVEMMRACPFVIHCSWLDLQRKEDNGQWWDETAQGKNQEWHNTSEDIRQRVRKNKDRIVNLGFDIFDFLETL